MIPEIGEDFGHYHVTAFIGEGGMGRVYRATDTVLHREVALKVLPAHDPERLARFEREAQVLASLNHPGIASLYGIEVAEDGSRALVMELVEGDTLATVITNQGAGVLPVAESLRLAFEIADALGAAHERGVIHRDLKPSNIKLTSSGRVKILDFGLAKALDEEPLFWTSSGSTEISELTGRGAILGTAAYMSPEQARGQVTDRRTDIWSFGAVFYELLTGKAPFSAPTPVDVIASVLQAEPDFGALPPEASAGVRAVLRRTLEKSLDHRLRDIGDVAALLSEVDAAVPVGPHRGARGRPTRAAVVTTVVGMVTAALVAAAAVYVAVAPSPPAPAAVGRFRMTVDDGGLRPMTRQMMAISPDGTRVAFAAGGQLWLRSLDDLDARPVPGSQGGEAPVFSPDGEWVGFWAEERLLKAPISGGAPQRVAESPRPWGLSWSPGDELVFGQGPAGVWSVPADGGVPTRLVSLAEADQRRFAYGPVVLPGGAILFTLSSDAASAQRQWDDATIMVARPGEAPEVVLEGGTAARVLTSGHLVFASGGSLSAVRFHPETHAVSGVPLTVLEGVRQAPTLTQGTAHFDVSANGTLVYVPRSQGADGASRRLALVDREGVETPLPLPPAAYYLPRFSPDGRRVALDIVDEDRDIWIYDLERDALNRLTFGPGADSYPVWARDGDSVIIGANPEGGARNLYRQVADGSSPLERLTESDAVELPYTVSPDGQLVYTTLTLPGGSADLAVLALDGTAAPRRLTETPFTEAAPALSPDGRWLAYASNESGRFEVYVTQFPSLDGKWQVSTDGGNWPSWFGDELYFVQDNRRMMAVSRQTDPRVRFDPPRELFEGPFHTGTGRTYDVTADGEQFLVVYREEEAARDELHVVLNWHQELEALLPPE